jgi:CheY-like chemotaxis protein
MPLSAADKTILLVEDNRDDADLTMRALRKHGLTSQIVHARDGVDALEQLFGTDKQPPLRPHLMLLDLKMPRIDGLEVLRRLRADERTRLVPVVIMTSSNEESDLVEAYRLGANSYIRKPVDFVQFTDAVRTLGVYWLVLNVMPPGK